ncbi:hypothetical protein QJS66_18085 [Kocuria rhizophila]|nr:hypothetical protein QJS66_18085 [Kocuria rhizophila]
MVGRHRLMVGAEPGVPAVVGGDHPGAGIGVVLALPAAAVSRGGSGVVIARAVIGHRPRTPGRADVSVLSLIASLSAWWPRSWEG